MDKKLTSPIAYTTGITPNMVYGMQEDANEFYIGLVNKLLNMLPDQYVTKRSKIEPIYNLLNCQNFLKVVGTMLIVSSFKSRPYPS